MTADTPAETPIGTAAASAPQAFFATAARNLETLLAEELRGLGIATARDTRAGVRFTASAADAYRDCLDLDPNDEVALNALEELSAPQIVEEEHCLDDSRNLAGGGE